MLTRLVCGSREKSASGCKCPRRLGKNARGPTAGHGEVQGEKYLCYRLVQTSGLLSENFKFIRFSDMPGGNLRYLLFSKTTDKAIIDRVDAAIIEQRAADPADPAKDE